MSFEYDFLYLFQMKEDLQEMVDGLDNLIHGYEICNNSIDFLTKEANELQDKAEKFEKNKDKESARACWEKSMGKRQKVDDEFERQEVILEKGKKYIEAYGLNESLARAKRRVLERTNK